MRHASKLFALALLAAPLAATGCEKKSPEEQLAEERVEAIERQAEETEEILDRTEEAVEETASGIAEGKAAAAGEGEIAQEVEGYRAKREVDEAFEEAEDELEQRVEAEKELVRGKEEE